MCGMKFLKEIQAGEHTNLFEEKSNYQNINLVQVNDVAYTWTSNYNLVPLMSKFIMKHLYIQLCQK